MTKLHELAELGQSIWLDYIRRQMLKSGELNQLHQTGVRGVTSNPSIFEKAIAQSDDYADDLNRLIAEDRSAIEIYEALAIEDIRHACDIFMDLYRQTDGEDGYVSLEANPQLAYKTEETIDEARRLFADVDRPNAYIKVPATPHGIPAIRQLISEGINVNVTLIFAISAYEQVVEAYLAGLEEYAENGGDLSKVSSVASFFVSRVDSKVDEKLEKLGNEELLGKIGIANAKVAYQRFLDLFSGPRWQTLAEKGARVQRPLWGSTSTKNPDYPDTLYVDELIGPHTVNTVPPKTLDAFLDHGTVERTIDKNPEEAQRQLEQLAELGISLEQVTDELLEEGVEKFAAAFTSLLQTIEERKQRDREMERARKTWEFSPGKFAGDVEKVRRQLEADNVLQRLWQKDHTLWSDDPQEISNRLDWVNLAQTMQREAPRLSQFAEGIRDEGLRRVVLLGMGGSSLAPELFARAFGAAEGYPQLTVLDSTDPAAISAVRGELEPKTTLFVVSSKSGTTIETLSLFKYFYNWEMDAVGKESAGSHFVAITDEGSKLAQLAEDLNFRAVFRANPNVGGRYSALTHFGLVPAALLGLDIERLLTRAQQVDGPEDAAEALQLGAMIGALTRGRRNKMTIITSPEIRSFGDWAEQLVAESTGKAGTGVLPIVGEPPLQPKDYGDDRFFVYLRLRGGTQADEAIKRIKDARYPLVVINLNDRYALAEQFVVWEIATAIAGRVLGIQPFNQPNVESAKRRAQEMLDAYEEQGALPEPFTTLQSGGVKVQDITLPADTPAEALNNFVDAARPGDYIGVHAYVQPSPETDAALAQFRRYLIDRTGVAVTVGYGPRFLHSTGQLHKGDAGRGHFIQLVSEPRADLPIPDAAGRETSSMTFGALKLAQALGDAKALKEAGRRLIRFYYGAETPPVIAMLMTGD